MAKAKNTDGLPSEVVKQGSRAREIQQEYVDSKKQAEETTPPEAPPKQAPPVEPKPKVKAEKKEKPAPPKAKEPVTAEAGEQSVEGSVAEPPNEQQVSEQKVNWEQKYQISEGLLKKSAADSKAKIITLENDIAQMRDIVTNLSQQPPEETVQEPVPPVIPEIHISQEEIDNWGGQEQFDFQGKNIRHHLLPIEQRLQAIESLLSRVDNIDQQVQGMIETHKAAKEETMTEQLDRLAPDWDQYLSKDGVYWQAFTNWAQSHRPDMSEFTFAESVEAAIKNGNVDTLAKVLQQYKKVTGVISATQPPTPVATVPAPPVSVAVEEPGASLEEMVTAPDAASDIPVASGDDKPTFTRRDYLDQTREWQQKRLSEDGYNKFKQEYHEAMADGRIRP